MRRFYTLVLSAAAVLSVSAQQLPNVGFEGEWTDSRPWSSKCDTLSMRNATLGMDYLYPNGIYGMQPAGWTISNVLGIVSEKSNDDWEFIGYGSLGATETGDRVEGCNSESAVRVFNNHNPLMATQIVPGYITLGTSWATNSLDFMTFSPTKKDGGVFGGMEFDGRPDALAFDYKLKFVADAAGQKATVLYYAWKGSWSQDSVPGNNTMSDADLVFVTMLDRDRNILGMETSEGGAVSHSDDAELVAKSLNYIETEDSVNWNNYVLPIDYLTASVPAKMNLVISANDYFDSENIVEGTTLTIDNVKLLYYSRLKSLSVDGLPVEGFDSGKYEYDFPDVELPEESKLAFEPMANEYSAKTEVIVDPSKCKITIKVSNLNEGGLDVDGKAEHEYVLKFKGAPEEYTGNVYEGTVTIDMGAPMEVPGEVYIIPTVADVEPALCTFVLPNFSLGEGMDFGDIKIENVTMTPTADGYSYEGEAKGLSLKDGAIIANVKMTGTTTNDGVCSMDIPVVWLMDPVNDPEGTTMGMNIAVKFNGQLKGTTAIESVEADCEAPVEYFNLNGVRVNAGNLVPGIYIKRQGNKAGKVYVK